MSHGDLVGEHSQNFRDIAGSLSDLKERVGILETTNEHFESRITARDEEIKALIGLVYEIKQMRVDFNKVADVVANHGVRLDKIQSKPGDLALALLTFVFGVAATSLVSYLFQLL